MAKLTLNVKWFGNNRYFKPTCNIEVKVFTLVIRQSKIMEHNKRFYLIYYWVVICVRQLHVPGWKRRPHLTIGFSVHSNVHCVWTYNWRNAIYELALNCIIFLFLIPCILHHCHTYTLIRISHRSYTNACKKVKNK